jgi:hypothetical protein
MKYFKFLAIVCILVVGMTLTTFGVNATSPRYIGLKYDATAHTLNVKVIHFSPAPKLHYVYRIEIDINGEIYQAHLYTSQPRLILLSYTYNVTVNPGDTLTVSAYCVLWGNLQKSQTVTTSMMIG